MKYLFKITALLLLLTSAAFSVRGDELDNYSNLLDRAENSFWRAAFSKGETTKNSYKRILSNMQACARRINQLEYLHSVPRNSGDLNSNVVLIGNLLTNNNAFRKRALTFSNLKKSSLGVYRKKVAKDMGRSSRSRPIPYDELSLTDYREFLNQIRDENIAIIEKRVNSSRDLNRGQKEFLLKTADTFYKCLYGLRLTVLQMRQQHPVFKKK